MIPILTKKQNYTLWRSGAFGNKLRAWRSIDDWLNSGFAGLVAIRMLFPGGPCHYNMTRRRAEPQARLLAAVFGPEWVMINEMAPRCEILQGEFFNGVLQDDAGALPGYFFYSTLQRPMRDALRERGEHTFGLRAAIMLRAAMTPSSYEDWRVLLDQYPGHVLEVSVYDRCLGDTPGRNALVWEVRCY